MKTPQGRPRSGVPVAALTTALLAFCAVAVTAPAGTAGPGNASATFAGLFADPPMRFRPNVNRHAVPADPADGARLIEGKLAEGYGGFTCNVAWTEDYLRNDGQFRAFFDFCAAAKARGMNLWLYDEKVYPSGMAGGIILSEHPEWEAEGLLFKSQTATGPTTVRATPPPGRLLLAAAVPVRDGTPRIGEAVRLEPGPAGGEISWSAPAGAWRIALVSADVLHQGYQAGQKRAGSSPRYPSLLVPGVTRRFIELTHARYAQALGRPLGSLFHATFTDEPSLMAQPYGRPAHGVYPWKACLSEEIRKRHGWRPEERLLELMLDEGPVGCLLRHQYFATVADEVSRHFFRAIREACEAQGLRSGGHLLLEESLLAHVPLYGNIFACFREMHVPGIDVLTAMPDRTRRYLYSARLAASAAELNGTVEVMSEPCPVADHAQHGGREGPTLEAQGTLHRQMIGGVTTFNNYLKLQNASSAEKRRLNTALARISLAMSGGRRAADIAVVYPIESLWTRHLPEPAWLAGWHSVAGAAPGARKIEEAFVAASDFLYDSRREFSYLDSRALAEATVGAGGLRHGAAAWKVLVLPRVDTLPLAAWRTVRKFWESGGAVLAFGALPRNSESEFPSPEVGRMFADVFTGRPNPAGGVGLHWETLDGSEAGAWLDRRLARRFTVEPADAPVLASHRVEPGVETVFLANDRRNAREIRFVWHGSGDLSVWDPGTGAEIPMPPSGSLQLGPYEGRIIRIAGGR